MTPDGRLGVAVVGLGVGEQHARAYRASAICELRTLFDLDRSKSERLAAEMPGAAVAGSFEEVLADPAIDVVSIASYDDAHVEQVVAALRARKHVFVEKPLCRSTAELQTIEDAWTSARDRGLGVNLVLRGAPLYRWLREAIADGELGEVYAFDGDYLYGRIHKITEGWRKDVVDYSVIQGGGVHLVDLMLWLTGQRPVSVTASGNRIATLNSAFRYDDFVAATYRFESGMIGRITANFGCVHPHQHVVRVFGTRATLVYDDCGPRLQTSRDPEHAWQRLTLSPLPSSKGVLIPAFAGSIAAGRTAGAGTPHEFDVIRACLGADRALQTGASTEIIYP